MLMQIVYTSEACKPMADDELSQLVEQSKRNNAEFNITGLLVYCNQHFLQLLEGEEEHVRLILNTIKQDTRHKHFEIIASQMSGQRVAENWSMILYKPQRDALTSEEEACFKASKSKVNASMNADLMWRLIHRYVDLIQNDERIGEGVAE